MGFLSGLLAYRQAFSSGERGPGREPRKGPRASGCPKRGPSRAQGAGPLARLGAPRGPEQRGPHSQRPTRGGPAPGPGDPAKGGPHQPPTPARQGRPARAGAARATRSAKRGGPEGPAGPGGRATPQGRTGRGPIRAASACGWAGTHRGRATRARAEGPTVGRGGRQSGPGRAVASDMRRAPT